ncbi:MAG: HAMP domain-containing sensor histidine kinase [Mucilaginibacter sp.]
MASSPLIIREEEHLLPFQPYNILDTLLEREFDELCALASAICQTPVALISLLEQEKHFIKSVVVHDDAIFTDQYAKYAETIAFSDDLLVINNPIKDTENADSAVAFYAGIPLINAEGQTMGSLCVIDMEKRSLSELQTAALKILAGQVMAKLELKKQDIELKKAYQALEDANQFTQKFAAMAAHDIKNPLSSISLTAEILKARLEKLKDEACLKLVNINISGIKKLNTLLDDMLAYSKDPTLLRDKKQFIDIPDFLIAVVAMLEVPENMDIKLPLKNFRIQASYVALEQIFINLFTNAIRYNDKEQGKIQVRFQMDNDFYYFEIEDNGIGIAKNYHDNIFSDNFTLRVTDRYNKKGNGIGLATVRELVKALNGTISVKSEPGIGTTFFIALKR